MRPRRPLSDRRRAVRRDILATLAFAGAIFVSILALPVGRVHARTCAAVSAMAGHEVPCGLAALDITLDTDRKPFVFVSLKPLRLKDMLGR
jgi:hypothetical protein